MKILSSITLAQGEVQKSQMQPFVDNFIQTRKKKGTQIIYRKDLSLFIAQTLKRNPQLVPSRNSDWRSAHISPDLENALIELKNERGNEGFVLPHLTGWDGGFAGTILRNFLKSVGIEKYVNFHTLRACFATHVLASGAEPTQVMKMGGLADFKTFQIYVRMAEVDVKGVTDNFKVMPKVFEDEKVVKIR